jgi:flagellin
MALTIANNALSLTAQNNLSKATGSFKSSLERLSSGFKVNRGADGPAALVISEKQRAQIAGLRAAIDNSEKAVALVQTAEGALDEINSLLVKVRSLAIDSANEGVNDDDALAANQAEIDNALDTINRIANNTQFGTKKLLDGSAGINGVASQPDAITFLNATQETQADSYTITVDTAAERATVSATTAQTASLANDEILTINSVSVSLNQGMSQAQVINRINEFSAQTGVVAELDGTSTRLYTEAFGSTTSINVISNQATAANSTGFNNTADTDVGVDAIVTVAGSGGSNQYTGKGDVVTADLGGEQGLTFAVEVDPADATQTVSGGQGTIDVTDSSLSFQIGPNANQNAQIAINKASASSLGIGELGNQFSNLGDIKVLSAAQANDSLAVIDAAIDDVTNQRGELGAFQQNTLQATANNLRVTLENTINAESVIRDTDFAEEISEFTKQQVLQQAGASVLSSANQVPQLVLSLLG